MRVIPCMLLLACLCATSAGCSLFKKNTNSNNNGGAGGNVAPPKFPDPLLNSNNIPQPPAFPTAPASGTSKLSTPTGSSMLAGRVVDAYHQPIGNVYVRWINLEEKEKDGAPIDVAANANGHFIIQGLKSGTSYKLIARTKLGDKMLAGTALTTAPNVHVLIPISEDRVNSSTPPLPSASAEAQGMSKNSDQRNPTRTPNDPFLGQGNANAEPRLPATMNVPAPPTSSQVGNPPSLSGADPAFVPGVVEVPKDRLPMLNLPAPTKPIPPVPGDGKLDTGPARVPSCVVVGNRVENLALKDSNGNTWEYRKKGLGKLVLIDFWKINCLPCRLSVPDLNKLHQKYGSRGLEVVGIALESDAAAVNKFCAQMQIGYRQVMGRSGSFDVSTRFNPKGMPVPTIILLNQQGDIIFHEVGRLDAAAMSTLERNIRECLNPQPFR